MKELHPWNVTREGGLEIQNELQKHLQLNWDGRDVSIVAGVDVSYRANNTHAAAALFRFSDMKPLLAAYVESRTQFPYIPGLLAFREGPVVLSVWKRIGFLPDLILIDAHGVAHPRGLGLASHIGLWLETPTIGVAKSRLYGRHIEPGLEKGSLADLHDEHEQSKVIGAVLRTRSGVKPVYISPGHLIDLPAAIRFVRHCCTRYRLPEPLRWAHRLAQARGKKAPGWQAPLIL